MTSPRLTLFAVLLSLGLILNLAACSGKSDSHAPPDTLTTPTVVVTTVQPVTVPIFGEYVGQTEAVNTVDIRAQVQGFLKSIDFTEGSTVRRGQLLFTIDPRPYQAALQQAKAELGVQQAAYADAQVIAERDASLRQQGIISEQDLDTAQATAKEDKANVASARAKVASAQLNLNYTRITTPITGVIGVAQVRVGGLVQAGTTLLDTVYSISPMYVTFGVSQQTYLQYVQRGRPNRGHPPPIQLILSSGIVYAYSGTIDMVSPTVNTATGTLTIRVSFPNPAGVLKPGLFARVRFVARVEPNAIVVPQAAIQQLQGTQSVFVVGPGDKVAQRTITAGPTVGNLQVVASGLKAGDRVIVEGTLKVRPGMTVQTQSAPQPPVPPASLPAGSSTLGSPGEPQAGAASLRGSAHQ